MNRIKTITATTTTHYVPWTESNVLQKRIFVTHLATNESTTKLNGTAAFTFMFLFGCASVRVNSNESYMYRPTNVIYVSIGKSTHRCCAVTCQCPRYWHGENEVVFVFIP